MQQKGEIKRKMEGRREGEEGRREERREEGGEETRGFLQSTPFSVVPAFLRIPKMCNTVNHITGHRRMKTSKS